MTCAGSRNPNAEDPAFGSSGTNPIFGNRRRAHFPTKTARAIEVKTVPANKQELNWDWVRGTLVSNKGVVYANYTSVPVGMCVWLLFL